MKTIDDSLEWHDENELVRRLDVVEAVLNLADTIDDVIDVIMSVPTYKVQTSTNIAMGSDSISTNADRKTENSSEKPNNCEHITEDGVTCAKYPACDDCPDNPLNKVKGSERLVKGSEIPNNCEPQTEECPFDDPIPCEWVCTDSGHCKYKPKDEPQTDAEEVAKDINSRVDLIKREWEVRHKDEQQTNADQHVQHVGSVETMSCQECLWCADGQETCANPSLCVYKPKDEPQTDCPWK